MAQGEPKEFYEQVLNKLNNMSSADKIDTDEFYQVRHPSYWPGNQTTGVVPWIDEQNNIIQQLEYLKQIQQQKQINQISAQITPEIVERLDKIDKSIEMLFNMLKLILTTQLEKEMRDSEKSNHSELS